MAFTTREDDRPADGPAAFGGSSEITEINVTPLVDVTLVLLVIFMVTASLMLSRALPVKLPAAATAPPAGQVTWEVTFARNRAWALNGKGIGEGDLMAKLRTESALRPDLKVDLAADEALAYRDVVAALDLLRRCGVKAVSLAVAP